MIISVLLSLIKIPFILILKLLPDINISIPDGIFSSLESLLYGVGYILPLKGLLPILIMNFAIWTFKIIWNIILRIKSFIPSMGD